VTEQTNYYKLLGLDERADETDIKRAYRKLALKYHPDRNPGDKFAEDKFKKVTEAYRILSDSSKRSGYDRSRFAATGRPDFDSMYRAQHVQTDEVFDLFDTFSATSKSSSRTKHHKARGADLTYNLTLAFAEAILGATTVVETTRLEPCSRCNGTGIEPKMSPLLCPTCLGKGRIRQSHGFLGFTQLCPDCDGTGKVRQKPCVQCRGESRISQKRKISVKIPPDVSDGTNLKVAGDGDCGIHGGPAGDLYIHVHVRPHEFFERKDRDIWYDLPLNITQAILGAVVEVPTLEGHVRIRIPSGTQEGRVFRLSKKGVPSGHNGHRGDLLVKARIRIPTEISRQQRHLLEEFARLSSEKPSNAASTWWQISKSRLASWLRKKQ
jgi:molecular chaperone DnaJ